MKHISLEELDKCPICGSSNLVDLFKTKVPEGIGDVDVKEFESHFLSQLKVGSAYCSKPINIKCSNNFTNNGLLKAEENYVSVNIVAKNITNNGFIYGGNRVWYKAGDIHLCAYERIINTKYVIAGNSQSGKDGMVIPMAKKIDNIYTNGSRVIKQIARGWVCLSLKKLEEEERITRKESKKEILFLSKSKL